MKEKTNRKFSRRNWNERRVFGPKKEFGFRDALGVCHCCLARACHNVVDFVRKTNEVCNSVHYDI